MELIANNNIDEADSLLESIDDTCDYETNLKQVFIILLESKFNHSPFTSADTSTLEEIAGLHSLIGGKTYFIARALLKWDLEMIGQAAQGKLL